MADYGSFCPIALGSEVLADRWTPLVLRELILGNTRFNDIARGLPGIPRSLLVKRLQHLERKGVIVRQPLASGRGSTYHLTAAGRDLEGIVMAIGHWAVRWLYHELHPRDIDAVTLTWWMHRRVDHTNVPDERVVVEFAHTAPERLALWMLFDRGDVSVCLKHPGVDADVVVTASTPDLGDVFAGVSTWSTAVDAGIIRVDGPPRLVRALPRWFLWSPFGPATRAAGQSATRAKAITTMS